MSDLPCLGCDCPKYEQLKADLAAALQLAAERYEEAEEAHAALGDAVQTPRPTIARLREELSAANRELERWRHGATVEGDFVCPNEAELEVERQQCEVDKDALRRNEFENVLRGFRLLNEQRDAAIRERDDAREQLAVERADCVKEIDRADAAVARAEKAEQELDELLEGARKCPSCGFLYSHTNICTIQDAERDTAEAIAERCGRLEAVASSFIDAVEAAERANARRGNGGQQVPFHGDFCSANFGTLIRLGRWARDFAAALDAKEPTDDDSRCAVCGWPLQLIDEDGCVRGNCSTRPRPELLYAPERARKEQP